MHDVMAEIFDGIQSIRIDGHALEDGGASSSMANPPRWPKKKPNKFSHSKFKNARGRECEYEDEDED